MNHLRKFNEHIKSDYYEEIPLYDFKNKISPYGEISEIIEFNDKDYNIIKSRLNDNIDINHLPYEGREVKGGEVNIVKIKGDGISTIYLYENMDEWFFIREKGFTGSKYYQCDQFEGLLMLLKDKGIIS
jgi:hypothetical protein